MDIIIEDGTGVEGANSFLSVLEAEEFFAAYEFTAPSSLPASMVKAFLFLGMQEYKGRVVHDTGAPFPRWGLYDPSGTAIDSDVIPLPVKMAQFWSTYYINLGVDPSVTPSRTVKKQKVASLMQEFAVDGLSAKEGVTIKDMPFVYGLLKPYLSQIGNQGRCYRA